MIGCAGHHRDIHSFPTRRSSDLTGSGVTVTTANGERIAGAALVGADGAKSVVRDALVGDPLPARSEEHTSELQSLRHLVCRLLLEKKKGPGWSRPILTLLLSCAR